MPSYLLAFVMAIILFYGSFLFAGYATFYDYQIDMYQSRSALFLSQKVGVHHVFSDLSFRLLSVGGYSDKEDDFVGIMNFGYGRYWNLSENYKFITTLIFEPAYSFRSHVFMNSFFSFGLMRRLSSRFSYQFQLGVPVLTINQKSSFIVSLGLNYFYGSGIAYRESSEMLKNVKKKFLWFLWFYD
tara:strand:+ start:42 stop:596 length:555 start_codon:yes stop_codon:yes gene_type:complete